MRDVNSWERSVFPCANHSKLRLPHTPASHGPSYPGRTCPYAPAKCPSSALLVLTRPLPPPPAEDLAPPRGGAVPSPASPAGNPTGEDFADVWKAENPMNPDPAAACRRP